MKNFLNRFSDWPIPIKIVVSFAAVMVTGSLLLALPFSQLDSSQATYFDHLFGSISMVAVTGLYTVPVAHTYNLFGQIVVLALIKLGGLGIITIVSAIILQFGRRVSMKEEVTLKQALNRSDMMGFRNFLIAVVKYTTVIEAIGAFFLAFHMVPLLGWGRGLFTSIFLAVSAFNNAGFDNLGTTSLQQFVQTPVVNIVIPILIVLGGIGFSVWFDVARHFKEFIKVRSWIDFKGNYRRLKLHTRLVIKWSLWLIVAAMTIIVLAEWNHLASIGDMTFAGKIQAVFFQAVTLRTAGFATIDLTQLHMFTIVVFTVFMFIGGSPGGTAGGAKTSTVALVVKLIGTELKGMTNVNYKKRTLEMDIVKRALVIVVMFVLLNFIGLSLMTIFDEHIPLQYLFFESVSAFGTVGLSADLTPELSRYSQTVIMFSMFIGRLGPITIFTALGTRDRKKREVTYATGNILIG
ncbi:Potassium uptake protein, integral membrane component, KtrB [Alkalibacterium sp. AK22]|uniref:TrkH family potassium uptake protein n=1 Tax=Alkalibacterium sp. AK22 TaxID=1229520 RepID=UPI00044DFD36|nr:potassium transporter TrkG [Alkalibacterium sp. AK22]EXJ23255.1 Potassium uptake protein, integral membrane component, KtrB [Alkalibacterium sp. AK22]